MNDRDTMQLVQYLTKFHNDIQLPILIVIKGTFLLNYQIMEATITEVHGDYYLGSADLFGGPV